jgi:glycosyltransferase involved in cell wall biosynthesis
MKKVLILTPSFIPDKNGMAYATYEHVNCFRELGCDVHVIYPENHKPINSKSNLKCYPISIQGSGLPFRPVKGDPEDVVKLIREIKPDLLICEGWFSWGAFLIPKIAKHTNHIALFSHGAGEKVISNAYDLLRRFYYFYFEIFLINKYLDKLSFACTLRSTKDKNRFSDISLFEKNQIPIFVVPNIPNFICKQHRKSGSLICEILVIGHMCKPKNQLAALSVLNKLPENYTLKFIFQEENDYSFSVRQMAYSLQISNRVSFFLGEKREDMLKHFNVASLTLIVSKTECQSLVMIDSLAAGVPVISTDVGNHSDFKGVFISPLNEMHNVISKIFNTPSLYESASIASIKHIRKFNSKEIILRRLNELLSYV